jgi:hypothetical protein
MVAGVNSTRAFSPHLDGQEKPLLNKISSFGLNIKRAVSDRINLYLTEKTGKKQENNLEELLQKISVESCKVNVDRRRTGMSNDKA